MQENIGMESFVKQLLYNHNFGANEYTRDLKSVEEYGCLLEGVQEFFDVNKSLSREALYEHIYDMSGIRGKIDKFIMEKQSAPGLVLTVGTLKHQKIVTVGNQQEINDDGKLELVQMREDSIFDLSSVTKLFTCVVVLKLVDEGFFDLNNMVGELDDRFVYLNEVSVEDLMTFRVPLKTDARIDDAKSLGDAERLIFEIKPETTQTRLYTDMGAIVLSYVIEKITGKTLYDLVKAYILDPCKMKDTNLVIDYESLGRTVSNNFERRINDAQYIVIDDIKKGMVNDSKARQLESWNRKLYGHAGLFSTARDMGKFARTLISGKILNTKWLDMIGLNQTGRSLPDGGYSQFHGYMCYSKNPVASDSEVNHLLSGNAFALGGYTGNQLTIDWRNQIYVFMASNRCHNRVTRVIGDSAKLDEHGRVIWNNGQSYVYSRRYAYDRDDSVINPAVELAILYRFVEELK